MNQSNPDNRSNRDMSMAARSAADLPIAPPPPASNPPPPPRMRPPASSGVAMAAQGMAPEIRAAIQQGRELQKEIDAHKAQINEAIARLNAA